MRRCTLALRPSRLKFRTDFARSAMLEREGAAPVSGRSVRRTVDTKKRDEAKVYAFIQWAVTAVEQPGFFTPELKKRADRLFFEEGNFVLAVLHGHLLV